MCKNMIYRGGAGNHGTMQGVTWRVCCGRMRILPDLSGHSVRTWRERLSVLVAFAGVRRGAIPFTASLRRQTL